MRQYFHHAPSSWCAPTGQQACRSSHTCGHRSSHAAPGGDLRAAWHTCSRRRTKELHVKMRVSLQSSAPNTSPHLEKVCEQLVRAVTVIDFTMAKQRNPVNLRVRARSRQAADTSKGLERDAHLNSTYKD